MQDVGIPADKAVLMEEPTGLNGKALPDGAASISGNCRTMFEGVGFGVMLVDPETRIILEVNNVALRMLQMEKKDVVGRICHKFICPAEAGRCPVLDLGKTVDRSERVLCRSGGLCVPVLKSVLPTEFEGRKVLLESLVDISDLKAAQELLRVSEQRYALAAAGANDGLWDWDLKAHSVYYSERWKNMLGYNAHEIGESADEWFRRVHPEDYSRLQMDIERHLQGETLHLETEVRMRRKDGMFRWMLIRAVAVRNDSGEPLRMAGSQTDITARKQVEEELRRGAFYDSLTGLANRTLFIDRLENCMARARRQKEYSFAVLFMDLDRFKVINDSLGHQMGDRLLSSVAVRLRGCLRECDTAAVLMMDSQHTVARLGGDEFTILLDDVRCREDAVRVAERICNALGKPFDLDGQEVFTTASIGIVLHDGTSNNAADMLRDADTALYRAKAAGCGHYAIFDEAMHAQAVNRLMLDRDLRRALERRQFEVHYQPIVKLATGQMKGFEALVRWNHPERGMILPGEFILFAEEMGLLVPIGWFVMNEACRQIKAWQDAYPRNPPLTIAVNMSSLQIRQPNVVPRILEILEKTGLSASSLEIEITEGTLLHNDAQTLQVLNDLKKAGIILHMDDFGTGYSSLSYLNQFPIDVVKIDRSFVSSLETNGKNAELVEAILTMAEAMGIKVIAEGIESEMQRKHLKDSSCLYGQGYLFSRPMNAAGTEELLAKNEALDTGPLMPLAYGLGEAEQSLAGSVVTS